MKTDAEIQELIAAVKEQVIAWRRHFHRNPELSYKEFETSAFIYKQLESFGGYELSKPTETSIMARLIGKKPGKTIAMRADIDALPILEENTFDFISTVPGVMHACGHDSHAAILLGAAKIFSGLKEEIEGEIRLFFQHAEEVPPGGASQMIAAGVMEGVDRVIGLHVSPGQSTGMVALAEGPITADGMNCKVRITGQGGHSSMPEATIDPIAIAAQIVVNLQHIVSRNASPFDKLVFSTTRFNSPGEAFNVTPGYVDLGMNARGVSEDFREKIPQQVEQIVKGITEAHGASYEMEYEFSYKPVVNDSEVTQLIRNTMVRVYGQDKVVGMTPVMGGEDFSSFSYKAPGCFMMLGVANPEVGSVYINHHPKFTVDEEALAVGVGFFVHGGLDLLK